MIPRLIPPPGVRHLGGSAGFGGDSEHSTTILETDMDLAAINAHYNAQFEAAGWIPSNAGHSGPQAWSTWTFTDGPGRLWYGLFAALRFPDTPRRHFLQVHVGRVPDR